jgi:tetratricopeptide (TPR) repeat protein
MDERELDKVAASRTSGAARGLLRSLIVRTPLISLISLISLLSVSVISYAQMELGVMQGTIVDEAGKPVEGVAVKLRDLERGREIVLKSDKSGKFYRRGLQAVEYEMNVEKEGYQPIKDKVKLVAGTDRRFDFKLAKATPAGAEDFQAAIAAFNKGDFAAAAKGFEAAIQKAPNVPDLYVNLAVAYFRLDRKSEAVAQLEKAASLGANDPKIHYQLGSAYVDMQQYDQAIASFEKGLANQPNLAIDQLALEATQTLGAVYFAKGDNEKATAQFEKALAAKPGAAGATLGLGKVYFSKGEVDKAVKMFEQVVAAHPGTPEATQADAFLKELKKSKGPGAL